MSVRGISVTAAALILTAALAAGASAATAPSAAAVDLLERHRLALGALPWGAATWNGTISQNGLAGAYVISADRLGRYRLDLKLPLSSRAEGDDGRTAWNQDENGNTQTLESSDLRSLGARLLGFNAFIADPRVRVDQAGTTVLDGHNAYRLNATLGRFTSTVYLDERTLLVDGADIGIRKIRYQSYRRFQGLAVPTTVVEDDGSTAVTTSVNAVTFKSIPSQTFVPPASRQPAFPTNANDVSIRYDPLGGLIVVGCSINGKSARFLIDSGSTSSIIDAASAARLGLARAGSVRVEGTSIMTGTIARADSLEVGGVSFKPFVLQAVTLNLPGYVAHENIDGVLGYDFLAQLVVRIAPGTAAIRLIAAPSFAYSGTGAVLPIDEGDRVPRVDASIGDTDPARLQIDTGSDANLVLFASFANKHLLDFEDAWGSPTDYARGAGGVAFPIRIATLRRLNLKGWTLPELITQIVLHPIGAFSPERADGAIGMGTIGKFSAVFLDYPGKRLILER